MKVLAIMGSHRKDCNTELALDSFLSGITPKADIEKIDLKGKDIKVCTACGYCEKHYSQCVFKDDMTEIYEKFKQADAIVFASPVYFNSVSTLMKIMIDRIQMIFACDFAFKKPFVPKEGPKKKGYLISLGGARQYERQFIGSEICMDLVFKDLYADFVDHFKISETDRYPLKERQDELNALKEAGRRFLKDD